MVMLMTYNKVEDKYRLYRTVHEIIHPTISKKNISNYRIVLEDNLSPLLIFYPNKVSKIDKIIIYIPEDPKITKPSNKNDFCKDLAIKTGTLIISLDYDELTYRNLYILAKKTIKYLITKLKEEGVETSNIILMGASSGANIIANIKCKNKKILFYPPVGGKYKKMLEENEIYYRANLISNLKTYFSAYSKSENKIFPLLNENYKNNSKCLIIIGTSDPLYKENKEFFKICKNRSKILELELVNHGFLNTLDEEIYKIVIDNIKIFL